MFESCAQLWKLVRRFRSGTIGPADLRHHQHLAIALCYAAIMPPETALDTFREDLLRLTRSWGHESKYHETITHFWLAVAVHHLRSQGEARCLATAANGFIDRFGDKTLIEKHYSPALLFSAGARSNWVAPDHIAMP